MSESLPPHFHIATEGLLSGKTGLIALVGFGFFNIDIEITVEEKGAGGGTRPDRREDRQHVLVFHIKFRGGAILKRYEHEISPNRVGLAVKMVEKLNEMKLRVRSMMGGKSQKPINITISNMTQKGQDKP